MNFNEWLKMFGYTSYIQYRNRMYKRGYTVAEIDNEWENIGNVYGAIQNKEEVNKNV